MTDIEILERLHKIELTTTKTNDSLDAVLDNLTKLYKDVNGNGKPGLRQEVAILTDKVNAIDTNTKVMVGKIGVVIGIVMYVVNIVISNFGSIIKKFTGV